MHELDKSLAALNYPCYLVVYGPERNYRTKYRGEHCGAFAFGMVNSPSEAAKLIDDIYYLGTYREMTFIAISIVDGELHVEEF